MTHVLIRRGNLEIDIHAVRIPCERKGRDQGDVFTNQGISKTTRQPTGTKRRTQSRFSLLGLRKS